MIKILLEVRLERKLNGSIYPLNNSQNRVEVTLIFPGSQLGKYSPRCVTCHKAKETENEGESFDEFDKDKQRWLVALIPRMDTTACTLGFLREGRYIDEK